MIDPFAQQRAAVEKPLAKTQEHNAYHHATGRGKGKAVEEALPKTHKHNAYCHNTGRPPTTSTKRK